MYDNIKRLEDFDFSNKRVLMRLGLDMPLDEARNITDDTRIRASLPTVQYILDQNPKQVVIVAHMGRPNKLAKKGEDYQKALSMDVVADRFSELLGQDIVLSKDYMENNTPDSRIVMLENIRFQWGLEQADEPEKREQLAKRLASFGDIFINDAFSVCHREEASIYDVVNFMESGIGFLIDKEIEQLSFLLQNPPTPYIAILGGAKVEGKIGVIDALAEKVDKIYIVGAMEYAFRKAQGMNVGNSLCEGVDIAGKVLKAPYAGKIVLPVDTRIAREVKQGKSKIYNDKRIVEAGEIPDNYMGLDIGPRTVEIIAKACKAAKTVVWNGPAGMFEIPDFAEGTYGIAKAITRPGLISIVGGGDSVLAVTNAGVADKLTHVSTGGGASLEFLESGGHLVALDIQERKYAV